MGMKCSCVGVCLHMCLCVCVCVCVCLLVFDFLLKKSLQQASLLARLQATSVLVEWQDKVVFCSLGMPKPLDRNRSIPLVYVCVCVCVCVLAGLHSVSSNLTFFRSGCFTVLQIVVVCVCVCGEPLSCLFALLFDVSLSFFFGKREILWLRAIFFPSELKVQQRKMLCPFS